jgi:hypothetical protein
MMIIEVVQICSCRLYQADQGLLSLVLIYGLVLQIGRLTYIREVI